MKSNFKRKMFNYSIENKYVKKKITKFYSNLPVKRYTHTKVNENTISCQCQKKK